MATVHVVVNGRPYSVGCEDGQEGHVEALARAFDQQVQEVGEQVGQVGDLRLFLMAALVGADELAETRQRLAHAQSQLASLSTEQGQARRRTVEAIENASLRLEELAGRLD
jgi:cell division protein ZapA